MADRNLTQDQHNAMALLGSLNIPDRDERARVRRAARAWLNEIATGRRTTHKVQGPPSSRTPF